MTVKAVNFGKISPHQLLLDSMDYAEDAEAAIVILKMKEGVFAGRSAGEITDLLGMCEIAKQHMLQEAKD